MSDASAVVSTIGTQRYVSHLNAIVILRELERLFEAPKRPRMPSRLVVAEGSNGKTWLLKHFISKHPQHESSNRETRIVPIAFVNSPPNPNQNEFYERILHALGNAPLPRIAKPGDRFRQIKKLSETVGLRLLIIDEVHSMLAGTRNIQRMMANVIKDLSNELEVSIVLAGTPDAYNALQIDSQLSTRFPALELPNWRFDDDFRRLIFSFQKLWNVDFDVEDIGPMILARSTPRDRSEHGATIGLISEYIESAALHAAKEKRSDVKKKDFINCDFAKLLK